MTELAFAAFDFESLRTALLDGSDERAAVIFTNIVTLPDGNSRLLAKEFELADQNAYSLQGPLEAVLNPEFVARVTKKARLAGQGLVFAHSHPGDFPPAFSPTDDVGEKHLSSFLEKRHPLFHASLVLSNGGVSARKLGTQELIRVISIGTERRVLTLDNEERVISSADIYDRQVRVFGAEAQASLGALTIAIVGLGGTGSIVAQQLVHLGVRRFILLDPDTIESTNLNRVANASPKDVGAPKVDVAERYVRSIAGDAIIDSIRGDVIYAKTARELLGADLIFGCTDSHGSRAVIQQLSYQYLIPCIDLGNTIAVNNGRITHIYGRVQLLAPGLACFSCGGLLNANEVRRDMMTAFERQADPYLNGAREPAPAVMSLNGTVASLAVSMLLSVVADVPLAGRHFLYNAIASTLRTVRPRQESDCYTCSHAGSLARGNSWPAPGRQD